MKKIFSLFALFIIFGQISCGDLFKQKPSTSMLNERGGRPLEGIITGNGGGPQVESYDIYSSSFYENLDELFKRMEKAEPTLIDILQRGIREIRFSKTIKVDGQNYNQPCYIVNNPEAEVRAVYNKGAIVLCRSFFNRSEDLNKKTTAVFKVLTLVHELMHYGLDTTDSTLGDAEEEFVASAESRFKEIYDSGSDQMAFKKAVLELRALLDNAFPRLGLFANHIGIPLKYVSLTKIPGLQAEFPIPENVDQMIAADYIVPHFFEYFLAKEWAKSSFGWSLQHLLEANIEGKPLLKISSFLPEGMFMDWGNIYLPLESCGENDCIQKLISLTFRDLSPADPQHLNGEFVPYSVLLKDGFKPLRPLKIRTMSKKFLSDEFAYFLEITKLVPEIHHSSFIMGLGHESSVWVDHNGKEELEKVKNDYLIFFTDQP